ncbi:phage tail protein I [Thalassobius sp. I31.1]|uniref:phage tail protein I n=1 Tax=Thalassobius sp. I31.1 TaxID=2109912 RepID=UPI000D1B36B2|nr:phage tail protein I [Thalassobius sp. I31.1]
MSDLRSILPSNHARTRRALEQVMAEHKADLHVPLTQLWNPDTCPAHLLPWLAWALSVDFWDSGWSEDSKRAAIRESIAIHRIKGTLASIRRALKAAGYGDARVVERYGHEQYNRKHLRDGSIRRTRPDHWAEYRIILARPITIDQATQVRAILKLVAPARCHLKALEFRQALNRYDGKITRNRAYTRGIA